MTLPTQVSEDRRHCGRCSDGRAAGGMGRRRICRRFARDLHHPLRHDRAHRLRADRDGARARLLQEVRHHVHRLEGGVVGGHPRQAVARREPGDAHADRDAVCVDDGVGGLAGEADGDPVAAQPQRPGDHAQQQAETGGCEDTGRPQAAGRQGQGRRRPDDVRDDLSAGNPRDVDALLARRRAASIRIGTSP